MKTISILGTGWLGFALAKSCKELFKIKVSIRNEEKRKEMEDEGVMPFILNEESFEELEELLRTDYLFINFPPSKSKKYLSFLDKILSNKKISNIKKIIFISSTSIYPNSDNCFDENYLIDTPISKMVYDAEQLIKDKTHVIFRCAGLMGYNRIAGKYFEAKVLDSKDVKVNYVHRDDVINAVLFVIEKNISGVFNLSSSFHPTRKEVYLLNASKYGFNKPIFKNAKKYKNRIIDGSKIESLGFRYKYPNPIDYI